MCQRFRRRRGFKFDGEFISGNESKSIVSPSAAAAGIFRAASFCGKRARYSRAISPSLSHGVLYRGTLRKSHYATHQTRNTREPGTRVQVPRRNRPRGCARGAEGGEGGRRSIARIVDSDFSRSLNRCLSPR